MSRRRLEQWEQYERDEMRRDERQRTAMIGRCVCLVGFVLIAAVVKLVEWFQSGH